MGWGRWLAGRAVAGHSGATWGQAHEKKNTQHKKRGETQNRCKKNTNLAQIENANAKKRHKETQKKTQRNAKKLKFCQDRKPKRKKETGKKNSKKRICPLPCTDLPDFWEGGVRPEAPQEPKIQQVHFFHSFRQLDFKKKPLTKKKATKTHPPIILITSQKLRLNKPTQAQLDQTLFPSTRGDPPACRE